MFKINSIRSLQRTFRLAAVLATVAVPLGLFYGGAQPVAVGLIPGPWDKLAHVAVFAILASAMGYASGLRGKSMWLLAFMGALSVAVMDEWHQAYLPGRQAGWDDLAADVAGCAFGATALLWRARVHQWLEKKVVNHH